MHRGFLNGGSYMSLGQVYRDTTVPTKKNNVRKIFHLGGAAKKKIEPFLNQCMTEMTEALTE